MNAAPVFPITPYPPQSVRSGLVYLRNAVEKYFEAFAVEATVGLVGLKYRFFKLNQDRLTNANRVVFIPGEFDGDDAVKPRRYGTINRATDNSASVVNPREIAHWDRLFTLSVWAPPTPGDVADEQGAVAAAEDLLEQVLRAAQATHDPFDATRSIGASIQWGDVTIKSPPNEKSFGAELLIGGLMLSPFYDITLDYVTATAVVPRTGA